MSAETTEQLSNRLCHLADEVRAAVAEHDNATARRRAAFLRAGVHLVEAKGMCRHGQWIPFLHRTGVPERRAREMMKLARTDIQIGDLADLGGLAEALKWPEDLLRDYAAKKRHGEALRTENVTIRTKIAELRAEREALWQELAGDTPESRGWLEQMKSGEAEVERINAETAEIVAATGELHAEARQMAEETARLEAKSASLAELLREKQTIADTLRENIRLRARVAELEEV